MDIVNVWIELDQDDQACMVCLPIHMCSRSISRVVIIQIQELNTQVRAAFERQEGNATAYVQKLTFATGVSEQHSN